MRVSGKKFGSEKQKIHDNIIVDKWIEIYNIDN